MDGTTGIRTATIYRTVMDKHICPYGLQAKDLLEREGFTVNDRWLKTRDETDAFKHEHHVESTPQVLSAASASAATTPCRSTSAIRRRTRTGQHTRPCSSCLSWPR